MTESITLQFAEYGLLGLMVVLLLAAVVYMFKLLMNTHATEVERNTEVVKALTESSVAHVQVARSVEQTNDLLRELVRRQG